MPIYEYKVVGKGCEYCQNRFEVRQGITEAPLKSCPRCGSPVRRLPSRPFIRIIEPLSEKRKLVKHTPEEADKSGLVDGFAEDRICE